MPRPDFSSAALRVPKLLGMPAFDRALRILEASYERGMVQAAAPAVRRYLKNREHGAGKTTPFAVYFSDVPSSAYQIEQWLHPLELLNASVGEVALLIRNPVVARQIASQSTLHVVLADKSELVERYVRELGVRVIFYVNNSQSNFTTLRINGPVHVHLSHGESEKASMYSNQLKAYDLVFVAGDASVERIRTHVRRIDPRRLVRIGRPQLDVQVVVDHNSTPRSPITVLYAPTWEGDSQQMAYGSLVSHGEALINRLTGDPRFRLVFRPHPKSGSVSKEHRTSLRRIRRRLKEPDMIRMGHTFDVELDAVTSIAAADVVVCDVSAMAMDALGLNKPLVVCLAGGVEAGGLAEHVRTWRDGPPKDAIDVLVRLAGAPVSRSQEAYRHHVFSPASPDAGVKKFIEEAARAADLEDTAAEGPGL